MSNTEQYTVGWICALQTEYVAARAFLDKRHDPPETLSPNDNNHYTLGEIRGHQIVIAVLPDGEYGTSSAACVARDMLHSFPNVRFGLMVGIGGGVPTKQDIRLGDIVVSSSRSGHGGLLQYDFGKEVQDQEFHQTGFLNQSPLILRTAVAGLQAQYEEEGHQLKDYIKNVLEGNKRLRGKYAQPPTESDRLYKSQYTHQDYQSNCAELCDNTNLIFRTQRAEDEDNPAIHYGLIASGNRLIKDAIFRDKLAAEQGVLCFKMEAAGLINHFPCLVICGVCDYADSHNNKEWQGYAAMMAAAYAKDLLHQIVSQRVKHERRASEAMREIQGQLKDVSINIDRILDTTSESALDIRSMAQIVDLKELPVAEGAEFGTYMDQHEDECLPGTREELLRNIDEWAISPESKCIFWLNGSAGTGKSTISRTVAKSFGKRGLLGASFFFKRGEGDRSNATRFFPTITRQLFIQIPEIQPVTMHVLKDDLRISAKSLKEQFDKLVLQPLLSFEESNFPTRTVVITIDALDECENDNDIHVILQLLPQLKQVRLVHLRIFVTSRPELPIRLGFQDEVGDDHQDFILQQIPEPIIQHDISLFFKHKLLRIQKKRSLQQDWSGDSKTQALIKMSVPLFIFAATICCILLDYQWDPEDSLKEILIHQTDTSKLNGTYLPPLSNDCIFIGDFEMVGAKTPWPALSGVPEAANSPNQNFLTCVLNLHADAKSFISHNEQAGKQLPKPVIDFFEQVVTYCGFMQRQTTDILDRNAHLGPELASIKQTLQNVQQHTHSTQSSIRNQSHQSWASVVRNAPPPAHTISTHDASSTAPATPSELSKDREVIVKLRDAGAQKTYRKKSSAEIKEKAERDIVN
ncbi:uncharacterized protein KD926_003229 [Aspergillus affinis]|uniref:uncharacterized protein n=1 Tax=Aspergillus affinis TaxID=1070780 RepID=UPI0022FE3983|nr:uncharacterized protein KD926_003229 [Aspergillus affinis]KAI9035569.1 hypothetical protein KD926_003229 [Aspergillus affinis]